MGCAHVPFRAARPAQPLSAEIAAYYDYPARPQEVTRQLTKDTPRVTEWLMQFPLSASGFEPTEPVVEFEWFESKQPGQRPAILFNPILGGDYPLEHGICRYFAARGWHVALVHRKTLKVSPEHPIERLELMLRQAVVRMRQVVDWMEGEGRVDPERLGGFGISMGGMAGVIAAAVEPRLKAHVVVLAGGPIATILATSRDPLLAKPRRRYLEHNQMDLATFEGRVRDTVKTDPVALAPYVDPSRMFMVIALADHTIGRTNAIRLWEAVGRPEATFIPLGHYTSYLSLPYLKRASLRFFRKTLGSPSTDELQ